MKGLSVLKKLLILCSTFVISLAGADELGDILSDNKNILFDYEFRNNTAQSDMLERSWLNPIMLQYSKSFSKQFTDKTVSTGSFSIGIDQPIFRSGGIYYAIKYAQALRAENDAMINLKKREMIVSAVKTLFEIKKVKLQQKKQRLLIKNDKIDIAQKEESYEAGLIDSSFLDQAILKHSLDKTQALESQMLLSSLKHTFSLLSDKNPDKIKIPTLELISAQRYKGSNLELVRDKLAVEEKRYNAKITWAKYLPSVSLQGRYTDADINPLFDRPGLEEKYWTYGFTLSMPLNINMFSDIEASKVAHLKAQTEVLEREESIDAEYKLAQQRIKMIEEKIKLSKEDETLYKRLYKVTYNLEQAGEKTASDTKMMANSLEIRKLDQKIYKTERQIELLGLYAKVASVN
ncbi:MAG: TolC family protein [Campylobacterota bacterium]|nr:TolC family protein [Campylobacterota bacterium]